MFHRMIITLLCFVQFTFSCTFFFRKCTTIKKKKNKLTGSIFSNTAETYILVFGIHRCDAHHCENSH